MNGEPATDEAAAHISLEREVGGSTLVGATLIASAVPLDRISGVL